MKKQKISVLGLMMISSQVLLSIFLAYWLYSQFAEKKEILSVDIERGLRMAEEQVIDSLLASNIINPIINDTNKFSVYMVDGQIQDTMNLPFDFGLNLDSAQQMEMHISGTHDTKSRVFSRIERIDSLAQFGDQSIQSTITINEGHDTSNHLLIQGVKLLINTVGQFDTNHNNLYTFFSSNPDTAILTNIFHQFIEQNYNAFSVSWQSIDESQSSGKGSNGIVYASFLFEEPFGVVVTNYFYYLLKSISAQIVFAFILLLITAVAFRLAYINLKNQRKLLTIKNEFISNITHELKTPVSTVKVALEALLDFNLRNDPKRT